MTTQPPATGCPFKLDGTGADIHTEARALSALGPAARVELPGGLPGIPAWSVTDPGLIRRLLAHPDISKDAHQHWPAYRNGETEGWPLKIWIEVRNALSAYGAEHARLRRPLAAAFTLRRVRALAPRIKAITRDLLSGLDSVDTAGAIDLRDRFAWRLPLLVVNELLGVPEDLHDAFRDAVGSLFATDLSEDEAAAAGTETYRLLSTLVAIKSKQPGDDVTSALITAHEGGLLSEQELLDSMMLVIGASHETTANLLGHAVVNLLTHPDQLAQVTSGHASWDQVVDETLRHQAPIANILLRFPTQNVHDTESDLTFQQGDAIVINYAAAGRDRTTHGPDADLFDITRTTASEHLAFGHGTHFCPGAPLARLEASIALPMLFSTYPDLRLAVDPSELTPLPSLISNGHQHIPVLLHR